MKGGASWLFDRTFVLEFYNPDNSKIVRAKIENSVLM